MQNQSMKQSSHRLHKSINRTHHIAKRVKHSFDDCDNVKDSDSSEEIIIKDVKTKTTIVSI